MPDSAAIAFLHPSRSSSAITSSTETTENSATHEATPAIHSCGSRTQPSACKVELTITMQVGRPIDGLAAQMAERKGEFDEEASRAQQSVSKVQHARRDIVMPEAAERW